MKLTILASGSKANAAVLDTGRGLVLIDAGLSCAQLIARMGLAGIDPNAIDAAVLTHEHADHCQGLANFVRRHPVEVYANAMTAQAINAKGAAIPWRIFKTGESFCIGHLHVESFPVYHDAADPCGFLFTPRQSREVFGFATDLGTADAGLLARCQRATTMFVEANYAEGLLERCDRPYSVIERIRSDNGHLSNEQAAAAIAELPALRKAILGHLSSATNDPQRAVSTVGIATAGAIEIAAAFTPESERCKPPLVIETL